jgi:hypothetical protein
VANRTLDRNDNLTHREWPVSPSRYPLTGPSRGYAYAPPPRHRTFLGGFIMGIAYLCLMLFAFGFAGYMLAVTYFK